MITQFIASRKKPLYPSYPTYTPPVTGKPKHIALTGVVPGLMAEANRRDAICRALGKECLFREHDIIVPWSEKERDEMGDCRVTYIADTYVKFGKHNDWPENDNPMIVTIWSDKQKKSFVCTATYGKKKEVC